LSASTAGILAAADAIEAASQAIAALAPVSRALQKSADALRELADSANAPSGAFTISETAERLGVSRGYVKKLIDEGRLLADQHEPGVWRVTHEALARYRKQLASQPKARTA
jgi:excisionase family DNA binding protein